MNVEEIREYCLSLPHVTEHFPFDDIKLVFKIGNTKMFALISLDNAISINLKATPEDAISLREQYPDIIPGWHMNKMHWNTVFFNGSLSDKLLKELIKNSYELVFHKLTKKEKAELSL